MPGNSAAAVGLSFWGPQTACDTFKSFNVEVVAPPKLSQTPKSLRPPYSHFSTPLLQRLPKASPVLAASAQPAGEPARVKSTESNSKTDGMRHVYKRNINQRSKKERRFLTNLTNMPGVGKSTTPKYTKQQSCFQQGTDHAFTKQCKKNSAGNHLPFTMQPA